MAPARKVEVQVTFSDTVREDSSQAQIIEINSDGSDSISDVKAKVAAAFGGSLTADSIFLYFGPNDRKMGRQYAGDPHADEKSLTLASFSVLSWLDRFPSWRLGVKLMPPTPPAPGVAIKKAAALAEGKDPDKAVQEARAKGELLKETQLPPPWGPKKLPPPSKEIIAAYAPPKYPANSSPAVVV